MNNGNSESASRDGMHDRSERPTYPKRESHFAHRFTRMLTKSGAAQELGPEGCWLLAVIAHQEDAKRYTGPVTFYAEQLLPLCGFASKGRLNRVRAKAVKLGWLHHEEGGKSRPARYWCLIPSPCGSLSDAPVDEGDETVSRSVVERQADGNRTANGRKPDSKRNGSATANGSLSTLVPTDPSPPPDSWGGVAERLRKAGVLDPDPAIDAARKTGCAPELIDRMIEHWKSHPGAWEAGGLRWRVIHALPDDDPSTGWPPESDGYRAIQTRALSQARQRETAAADTESAARCKEAVKKYRQLEEEQGAKLDELIADRERFNEFCLSVAGDDSDLLKQLRQGAKKLGSPGRQELLEALSERMKDIEA